MIEAILVFNNFGKPRLMKFYSHFSEAKQYQVVGEIFHLVSQRGSEKCNFIEKTNILGDGVRIMYRHFTTLYFVFCCDASESELAILDLIQVFVEALDKCFKNVCELDLIFHVDRVHFILNEIVMGGVVLETNIGEIMSRFEEQMGLEVQENRMGPVLVMPVIPASLSDHLPSWRDLKVPDLSSTVREFGGI